MFNLREMTAADSEALAVLTAKSPDGGAVTFSPRFHVPAYETLAARSAKMAGVVAEVAGEPGLVGAARVSFGVCQFEGAVRPYALLSSLMVHPDYRRKGIAAALARWRIERAQAENGHDSLILADIQNGNVGSLANAGKWASQIGGRVVISPVPMRAKPPKSVSGITVRPASETELESVAANLNRFYRDYNFYRPQTADSLRDWLQKSPFDTPVNHYLVAVDSANRILAGMGIKEEGRLMTLFIERVPALIRLANIALKVIPPDNTMRNLQVEKLWFADGQLEAARYLWQTVRYEWRTRGSSLVCNYDPRSPIPQILQNPAWMPTTSLQLALRSSTPMRDSRLIDPLI